MPPSAKMVKSWNDSLGYSTTGAVAPAVPAGAIRGGGGEGGPDLCGGGGVGNADLSGGAGGIRGGGGGCCAGGAAVVIPALAPEALPWLPPAGWPHLAQNFAAGNSSCPHPVQVLGNRKPQPGQNFDPLVIANSQLGHFIYDLAKSLSPP